MRTYGGYHKVPGYISTFPPLSHPVRGPFTPFDSFWYRIKLWSAKPSIRTKKFFMIVFGGCRKVHSICQTSNTLIHHVEGVFPPKYDIFNSDSAKSQVSALETVPWLYSHLHTSQTLFHPLRGLFPPNTTFSRTWVCIGHCSIMIYSGCHKVPSHFQNNITFSLICIWNRALILPKTDYEHWKLFHADKGWVLENLLRSDLVFLISWSDFIGSSKFLSLPPIIRGVLWGVETRILKIR